METVMVEHRGLAISSICKSSNPCIHSVRLPTGETKTMNAKSIANIIHHSHPMYPHFSRFVWQERLLKILPWSHDK